MAETYTARMTAQTVTAALATAGLDRKVDAKRVRAFVRDTMPAYDDGLYTAHLYSTATRDRIVRGMVARYTAGRSASASLGRPGASKDAVIASVKAQGRKTHAKKNTPAPIAANVAPVLTPAALTVIE